MPRVLATSGVPLPMAATELERVISGVKRGVPQIETDAGDDARALEGVACHIQSREGPTAPAR